MLKWFRKKDSPIYRIGSLEFVALTDIGKKYDHNEDHFVLPLPNPKYELSSPDIKNKGLLFILCDGMGGARSGEVASELTANWIFKAYYQHPNPGKNPGIILTEIIQQVNEKIYQLSASHSQYQGMGSTLVSALFLNQQLFIHSVGDSRMYVFRGGSLTQITEDQSEVWGLYKMGSITKEEMRHHPRKHIIDRAIGLEKKLAKKYIQQYRMTLQVGELYLMCSDGLTDMVAESEIGTVLRETSDLAKAAKRLIDLANHHGGKDNITVILIRTQTA